MLYDPWLSSGGPRSRIGDFQDHYGGLPFYHSEGFLAIQNAIAYSYMEKNVNKTYTRILMQSLPYLPYTYDMMLSVLKYVFSSFLTLCFVYPCMNTVRFITIEKEKQLKAVMQIMGVSNCLQWLAWFVRTMIIMLISISLIVLALKVKHFYSFAFMKNLKIWNKILFIFVQVKVSDSGSIFRHSDGFALFSYLLVYSIAMTTFSFMLSAIFSRANVASGAAAALWFLSYVPYLCTIQCGTLSKLIACVGTNSAMAFGFEMIHRLEANGVGLQWSNFSRPIPDSDDQLTVGITMGCMVGEAIIYLLIALVVEAKTPQSFAVSKKPIAATQSDSNDESINFEDESQFQGICMQVKNLAKSFGDKVACKNLSLNAYKNQITVLLGNNGAGKSTAISMMVGMIQPTSGNIAISDGNSIGFCLQDNIFFEEFTVREQLQFFTHLKGGKNAEKEVSKYLELLELKSKMNAQTSSLSFGMKRKLAVGLALCGRSQVVFCDEPTSGIPQAHSGQFNPLKHSFNSRHGSSYTPSALESVATREKRPNNFVEHALHGRSECTRRSYWNHG